MEEGGGVGGGVVGQVVLKELKGVEPNRSQRTSVKSDVLRDGSAIDLGT